MRPPYFCSESPLRLVKAAVNQVFDNANWLVYVRVDLRSPQAGWHQLGVLTRVGITGPRSFRSRVYQYTRNGFSSSATFFPLLEGDESNIKSTEAIILAAGLRFVRLDFVETPSLFQE